MTVREESAIVEVILCVTTRKVCGHRHAQVAHADRAWKLICMSDDRPSLQAERGGPRGRNRRTKRSHSASGTLDYIL